MKTVMKILIAALCLFVPLQNSYGQQANAPSFKDGDWWKVKFDYTRREGVSISNCEDRYAQYLIKFDQGKFKAYGGEGNKVEELDCPRVVIRVLGFVPEAQKEEFERQIGREPQFEYAKFPLSVGKSWPQRIQQPGPKNKVRYIDIEYKVLSWEKIQTAKGEFEAFKIGVQGWPGGQVRTAYYAPKAKGIVSLEIKAPNGASLSATLLDLNVSE
jgi:hypothetical protein